MEEDRYTRITLRIPRNLHVSLSTAADATSKSLNAEIVARLERSFSEGPKDPDMAAMLAHLQYTLAKREAELVVRANQAGMAARVIEAFLEKYGTPTTRVGILFIDFARNIARTGKAFADARGEGKDAAIEKIKAAFEQLNIAQAAMPSMSGLIAESFQDAKAAMDTLSSRSDKKQPAIPYERAREILDEAIALDAQEKMDNQLSPQSAAELKPKPEA